MGRNDVNNKDNELALAVAPDIEYNQSLCRFQKVIAS